MCWRVSSLALCLPLRRCFFLNFWPSDDSPLTDPGLEPLTPLPTPEEPPQPPEPVPDVSDAVAAENEAPTAVDTDDEPAEAPAAEPAALAVALPPLDESDALVREQTKGVCLPVGWTVAGNLVRRASVLIENASRGVLPPKRGPVAAARRLSCAPRRRALLHG